MSKPEIKIKFSTIELLSKNLLNRLEAELTTEVFNFDIKADAKINSEINTIMISVDISIRELNKELILASISIGCAFEIENFEAAVTKQKDNTFLIPPDVDILLKSVAVSTARGIMFSEFRGTYLYNAILPIIIMTLPIPNSQEQQLAGAIN